MYDSIPKDMQSLTQWGLYRLIWVKERNKYTKIPISAIDGSPAKTNTPSTWTDFKTALSNVGRWDTHGLSFFFANGYAGIDVDDIPGEVERYRHGDYDENMITEFMNATKSYTEISVSKKGIHIVFRGKIPGTHRRKGNVEMYDTGRFFAITGNRIDSYGDETSHADISILYEKYLGEDKIIQMRAPKTSEPNNLSAYQIIEKALQSKSGDRFKEFMYGGWEPNYNSQSEADLAFANYLAFWTGRDFQKMDAIFRESSLYRDKYDTKRGKTTYGVALLNKAINDSNEVFTAPDAKKINRYHLNFLDKKESKPLPQRSYDDIGNADRMMDRFGDVVRYSYITNNWYIYNGSYWEVDQMGQIRNLLDAMVADLSKEKVRIPDGADEKEEDAAKKAFAKFITRSRTNASNNAVEAEFKHRVPVQPSEFDRDKTLLNVANGYIDLSSGELHDHDKSKMFSKEANVEYSENAPCEEWQKFLKQIFDGDDELIEYIQRAVGYSLTGSTKEQIMFVLLGNGRNGKSVFLETISNLLGTYSSTMQASSIMVKQISNSANSDIARLANARLVTSSEPNDGFRIDEGLVKQLTGGDKVVARELYSKEFEFEPEFKLWLATNHTPIIRGTDDGIWRRIRLIPFDVQIPKNKVDKDLKYKLARESVGILNWAVDGALKWEKYGLNHSRAVESASHEYRSEMDVLSGFIEDCCELSPSYIGLSSDLYRRYVEWAKDNIQYLMSSTKFGTEMKEKFQRKHTMNGNAYLGIRVIEDHRINFNR